MSCTIMYTVRPDGTLETLAEFRNSHGSAPQIWDRLAFKHLANCVDPDADDPVAEAASGRESRLTSNFIVNDLLRLSSASWLKGPMSRVPHGCKSLMEPYEWRTLFTTDPWVIVKPEHFGIYADALQAFHDEWHERAKGQPWSIGEQAAHLRALAEDPGGVRGVCWAQNSTCNRWDEGEMSEERKRTIMRDALNDEGIVDQSTVEGVINALAWQFDYSEHVPYNVDLDTRIAWSTGR